MTHAATGRRRTIRSLSAGPLATVWIITVGLTLPLIHGCARNDTAPACSEPDRAAAADWLDAVGVGDETRALRAAEALVSAAEQTATPNQEYERFFAENGLTTAFLSARFSHWDFQSWSHALFFARLATSSGATGSDPVTPAFAAVTQRLRAPDPEGVVLLWPYVVWQTGQGYCDRQAWVLCELVYQSGADAKIVYLRDPDTLVSPHTIAQLRIADRTWVADPLSRVLLPDRTVAALAANPELVPGVWQANPAWVRAVTAAKLWVPSYPQDYCLRNQTLHARLSACLSAACPRFGGDPQRRLESVAADREGLPCALWHYPLQLLAYDVAIHSST